MSPSTSACDSPKDDKAEKRLTYLVGVALLLLGVCVGWAGRSIHAAIDRVTVEDIRRRSLHDLMTVDDISALDEEAREEMLLAAVSHLGRNMRVEKAKSPDYSFVVRGDFWPTARPIEMAVSEDGKTIEAILMRIDRKVPRWDRSE